ncbi:MAG: PTS sugar transporter subunit IIB [Deltaproteobacteria bacterium]|nr:PTS sugar transporter subunit IIB [Deltaproteobacteria bacterium]
MVILVRVDDRLLHGQIICAWVPYTKADSLIVASDEAARDSLVSEIISSCGHKGLTVCVKSIKDAIEHISSGECGSKAILILGDLKDAMRIYEDGFRFDKINLGNIHHEDDGREITPSIIINEEDEEIMRRFEGLGVAIDIRDVPASASVSYELRKV